ncbi:MAG: hypothetical protein ACK5HR_05300 [Mycoplasmatales bacterium]
MSSVLGTIVVVAIIGIVVFMVTKERRAVVSSKKKLMENPQPGHMYVYRGYSDKGRNIDIIINNEVISTITIDNKRDDIIELTDPCRVTVSRAGKFKSSIEITQEDLLKPVFVKVVGSKYSNDIVKIPHDRM